MPLSDLIEMSQQKKVSVHLDKVKHKQNRFYESILQNKYANSKTYFESDV